MNKVKFFRNYFKEIGATILDDILELLDDFELLTEEGQSFKAIFYRKYAQEAYNNYEDIDKQKAEDLANAHWDYIKKLLYNSNVSPDMIEKIGFHYKTAFVHGFKHGVEDSGPAVFTSKSSIKVFDRNGKRIE